MITLPGSIQAIADVIGESSALTLVRNWPRTMSGTTGRSRIVLYVPTKLPDGHQLIDILGHEVAARLVQQFGGELLFLASGHSLGARERYAMIRRAVLAGMPRERVAIHFDVSQTTIKRAMRGTSVAISPFGGGTDHARMNTTNRASA
ncbi:hypothetical protein [Stenotrophomonas maltophilia]|uniref:hypothetical protein n=1 Tax=Stenotrophomonas maltophilia TaxID=40324 RepID=UPI002B1D9366|nr:hypothetical protein [Stenotrophomonas maltophilia]